MQNKHIPYFIYKIIIFILDLSTLLDLNMKFLTYAYYSSFNNKFIILLFALLITTTQLQLYNYYLRL